MSLPGGLNSYALSLLYNAFVEMNSLEKCEDTGKTFIGFLEFVTRVFDNSQFAVIMPQELG